MEVSILIPTYNEEKNIGLLIQEIKTVVESLTKKYEIIVADGKSQDKTIENARKVGAKVFLRSRTDFGTFLKEGIPKCHGKFIITLDADFSHPPRYIKNLWRERNSADIVICSRWLPNSKVATSRFKILISKFLNAVFTKFLKINITDLDSNFRLYKKEVFDEMKLESNSREILPEIAIKAFVKAFRIKEIPFFFEKRKFGYSKFNVGGVLTYFNSLIKLWRLRNSIESADYDERAFYSRIPIQRYWQRKRFEHITNFLKKANGKILDIGCGSSMIIQQLAKTKDIVGLDISKSKIKYLKLKNPNIKAIVADARKLPFESKSFDHVICSNLIEHLPDSEKVLFEAKRVLKKGGTFIVATPDYGTLCWRIIEKLYGFFMAGGYAHEHIKPYTKKMLLQQLSEMGFDKFEVKTILNSEIIIKCIKL
jgi:dolichol-phosphate mannosyltransferase